MRTHTGTWRARLREDRGQAAIEFTGTVPVILATLVLLWQAALIGYTFALAGNAADEAARAGAVASDGSVQAACEAAAREDLPGAWQSASIECGVSGGMVTASLSLPVPVLFPGSVTIDLDVPGEAAAPQEDP
ncbi:TadE/TadG family type IV pilus assembly protein [Streptomyces sp. NPDC020965]|uniref:TadE/TadG family type IV pilus assembly protein n=1 Tax=Streptomyces sp. NPDC020965 TaxID=3365105 RepID=UPI0037B636AF